MCRSTHVGYDVTKAAMRCFHQYDSIEVSNTANRVGATVADP